MQELEAHPPTTVGGLVQLQVVVVVAIRIITPEGEKERSNTSPGIV
jgi:hypothetical protein